MRRWQFLPVALSLSRLVLLLPLFCVPLFLNGCAELQNMIPKKPSVSSAKFEVEPPKADLKTALRILKVAETGELESRLTLVVENPNSVGLSLGKIGYRIFLKDLKALEGQTSGDFQIAAGGPSSIPIDLKLPLANIPGLAQAIAKGPETIPFKVEGEVGLTGLLSGISVPYSYSGQVGRKAKP